ncbi:Cytochrome b-c1 complex subunit 2, mitochondrial [Frankliniella fusca]|uniref:Cytochrome b-c1 complex subunit 2, mitochondrial n=2 Tax=Arthropoda TaxID=6656 RepID=A0AAE1LEN5_9NEOP|nr:Cytochrome b-c1 complex subunit 2, mitochondrial [Frankliniella fusca]
MYGNRDCHLFRNSSHHLSSATFLTEGGEVAEAIMSSNMAKLPLMRHIVKRGLASAAPRALESDLPIQTSVMANKIQVVSLENSSPIVRVAVQIKAGSRYETPENLGAAHVLRSACGLTTKGLSTFAITRLIQERGANLWAVNDRDSISYILECYVQSLEPCLKVLTSVTTEQLFQPWELAENLSRVKYELALVPPQARVLDMLHGAAYRTGLGNSLFIPKYLLGSQGTETLRHFVENTFLGSRTVISTSGLSHGAAKAFAERISFPEGSGSGLGTTSQYYGGELRKRGKGMAHIAIAADGAGINQKEALAFGILQHALGAGARVKYGTGAGSLAKLVSEAAAGEPASVSALNISHQDAGLFGVVISCEPKVAGKVTEAAMKALKAGNVSEEAIKRGKSGLKAAVLLAAENTSILTQDIGQQALLKGSVDSTGAVAAAIDSVSSSDVNNAARRVASGKLSMAALGDISNVPFIDQLK